jgi:hypothetical protein
MVGSTARGSIIGSMMVIGIAMRWRSRGGSKGSRDSRYGG